jgi:hypothetical protein
MNSERYAFDQSDEFLEGLARLQPGQLERVMAFLRDTASTRPTTPIPGRLKRLRGHGGSTGNSTCLNPSG